MSHRRPPEEAPARAVVSRRSLAWGALLTTGGVGAALRAENLFGSDPPALTGGYAAADNLSDLSRGEVRVHYRATTSARVAALTFDDGPRPDWTPQFLDVLDEADVPATFFLVGENVTRHADLVRDRMDRHEIGNHSWAHRDLATLDLGQTRRDLERTHQAIRRHLGRTPTLLRPPYGHLGGATVLAAAGMGYDIALWSRIVNEKGHLGDPAGEAAEVVSRLGPGEILLAHDVGHPRRLNTLGALPAIISGLREKGFRFTTVSEIIRG